MTIMMIRLLLLLFIVVLCLLDAAARVQSAFADQVKGRALNLTQRLHSFRSNSQLNLPTVQPQLHLTLPHDRNAPQNTPPPSYVY